MQQFNKIIKFEIHIILFLFKSSIKKCIHIWEHHWINIFIRGQRKKWYEYACFPIFRISWTLHAELTESLRGTFKIIFLLY